MKANKLCTSSVLDDVMNYVIDLWLMMLHCQYVTFCILRVPYLLSACFGLSASMCARAHAPPSVRMWGWRGGVRDGEGE